MFPLFILVLRTTLMISVYQMSSVFPGVGGGQGCVGERERLKINFLDLPLSP